MSLEGQHIGRYHLLHLLGSGGMGDVYLAEDARIEQQVAIKVIRTEASSYSGTDSATDAVRLFQREAKAIAKLDHPNILPLFDYGEVRINDTILTYLVMPYRQEGSLAGWLRQRNTAGLLSLSGIVHIVRQAADALQHAHNRQIIHQDVKPSNFLLRQREGTLGLPDLLLADFGIARLTTATANASQSIRGTPIYMAPELWEGEAVPATDQYALAVMTYELLTGRPPFQGPLGRMMYQHLNVEPIPPSAFNPRLSKEIDIVLLHALAKKTAMRFASISAFANALEQAAWLKSKVLSEVPEVPLIKIFYSYAHEDELLRNELEKHLSLLKRQGRIDEWYDRNIGAGAEWAQEIDTYLNTASIILLLISPDFMSSDYCYSIEMKRALERHDARKARVIPIILRPVDWQSAPFGKLQALPSEGRPITSWANRDEAFLEVTRGIRQAIQAYLQMVLPNLPPPPKPPVGRTEDTPQTWNIAGSVGPLIMALVTAQQWEQAEAEIRAITDRQIRARVLEIFISELIKAQQWMRAEAVARSVEDFGQRARLLGELSRRLGQAQEWRRAEAVARSIADDRFRIGALKELGQMLIQAGELERAREVIRSATPSVTSVPTVLSEAIAQPGQQKAGSGVAPGGVQFAPPIGAASVPGSGGNEAIDYSAGTEFAFPRNGGSTRPPPLKNKRRPLLAIALATLVVLLIAGGIVFAASGLPGLLPATVSTSTVTITPASTDLKQTYTISAVTGTPDVSKQQVQARQLSTVTLAQSQTAQATGQTTTSGTHATGTLTILNVDSTPATFNAGTVIPNENSPSIQMVLNATVTVPASTNANGGGTIDVFAHVAQAGTIGNVIDWDHNGNTNLGFYNAGSYSCCAFYNLSPFTGGQDAGTYTIVQQSDIDGATNALIAANTPNAQQVLQPQIQANEQFIGTPQCKPKVTSDHKAGDQATNVTVTVTFTCTGEVYDHNGALSLAEQLLKQQAVSNPGSGYTLVGKVTTAITTSTVTHGTITLIVSAEGLWVFHFTNAQKQALAKLIAGKSKTDAQALLSAQNGVKQAEIQSGSTLPTDPSQITIVVRSVVG